MPKPALPSSVGCLPPFLPMPEMAFWVAVSYRDSFVVNFYNYYYYEKSWKVRPDLFPGQPTQYPIEGRLLAAAETADKAADDMYLQITGS